jgi:hypothetical protein
VWRARRGKTQIGTGAAFVAEADIFDDRHAEDETAFLGCRDAAARRRRARR